MNGEVREEPDEVNSMSSIAKKTPKRNYKTDSEASPSSDLRSSFLGSMLKNDLGEILRRSCRERKSNTRFVDEASSSQCKSPTKDSPERRRLASLRAKSVPETNEKKDAITDTRSRKRNVEKATSHAKLPTQNGGDSLRSRRGNLFNLRSVSSSSNASSAVSQTENSQTRKRIKKRTWHFKGGTYSMSVHGRNKRKPHRVVASRYRHLVKSKSDLDQTDADETSKSSFLFDKQLSEDSLKQKDTDHEKTPQSAEKAMPILIESTNVQDSRGNNVSGPPVLEMQVEKPKIDVLSPKLLSPIKASYEMISPFIIPFAFTGEKQKISAVPCDKLESDNYYSTLCTCRSVEGYHILSRMRPGTYCEGVDCIDGRLIGCVNAVSSVSVFRPSVRAPFQALCELHRHRMRFHQSCPGCGMFCTQGTFIQCRADPKKSVHHSHKECLINKEGIDACPHCGESSHLKEVNLELNAPKATSFYQTQQLPFRKEPGARMAFTRGFVELKENTDDDSHLPSRTCKVNQGRKEISSAGLPAGPERTRLEKVIENLTSDKPVVTSLSSENMYQAAKIGDVEKIMQILMLGFDANTKFSSSNKQTVLHVAAAHGHLMLVHVLIQAGAAINAMDNSLLTPIMTAIEKSHIPVAQYLIKAGAQLDSRGEDAMTALHLAAKSGLLEICKLILDTGKININLQDDGGWTALIWACEFKHVSVVKTLLDYGSDPNSRDKEQNISLHWSAFSGSLEVSEMLLNRGCDINAKNEHGDTPLHVAARQDNYECVMLFLARNADVECVNIENETPIMCCDDQNSQTWLALSMTKHLKKISGSCATRSEIVLYNDVSRGKEQSPIQCVNGFDNEMSPTDFLYIRENCETSPITMDRLITSLQSCQCEDDCSATSCACCSMSIRCWYTKGGRLIDEFNFLDPPMIFECNRACRCWSTCSNRVLQHGITCRLQLFRTKIKGWGVRTLRDIPKGTFICEYVGEVISDLEADRREDDSYLFDLDNKDGESYCIDARYYGNISRFINHSCEPNLVPVKIFVDYQDLRFPRIALFSARMIKANEELGFDYGCKFWIIKCRSFTCACDSEKCKYSSESIHQTLANYNRRFTEEPTE